MNFINMRIRRSKCDRGSLICCLGCQKTFPSWQGYFKCPYECNEDYCHACGEKKIKDLAIKAELSKKLVICPSGHEMKIGKEVLNKLGTPMPGRNEKCFVC